MKRPSQMTQAQLAALPVVEPADLAEYEEAADIADFLTFTHDGELWATVRRDGRWAREQVNRRDWT